MGVQIGDPAPDFSLQAHTGESVTLASLTGDKHLVLFFYPKNNTAGCTAESCAFRDAYEDFLEAGATVVGISGDSVQSHQSFSQGHRLPFLLLSDEGNRLRRQFGVPKTWGLLPGRVTYVIDRTGVIRHMFNSQFDPKRHVTEALAVLASLD